MTDDKTKEIHIRIENAQSDFTVRVEHYPTYIADLLAEREVLREALILYADPNNFEDRGMGPISHLHAVEALAWSPPEEKK